MITNFLELSDGRRLCYAEYGDSNGTPIFVFYGNPGSRLLWGVIPGSPILPNVRLIAPDRPGYGQTDMVMTEKMIYPIYGFKGTLTKEPL